MNGEISMILYETRRLYVRNFVQDDWNDLYDYLSDREVVAFEPYEPLTKEECKKASRDRAMGNQFYAVCLKENDKLIGNLYVNLNSEEYNTWEIGYVFNRTYQKKGYASESTKEMLAYLFRERNARRIIAMCDPRNEPSWRLLERIGMKREAHFRKEVFFKKDENNQPIWKDTYIYAILKEDIYEGYQKTGF